MADSDTQLDIILRDNVDDVGTGAVPKFRIDGTDFGGDEQDAALIDVDIGGDALVVKCDLTQVVHGTMIDDPTASPATLAVFQFAFVPRGNNRRFKEVEITMKFSGGELHDIAPRHEWVMFCSEMEQELSHAVSPALEAAFGPGKATLGYTWQRKETKTIGAQARVEGEIRSVHQQGGFGKRRNNMVFWGLYENKQTRSGIPSLMQAVVLLKRKRVDQDITGEKFSAEITIQGEVDRYTYVKDKWEHLGKSMSGKARKGEDVIFNPKTSRGAVRNAKCLKEEDLGAYQQLVTVREWADGRGETSTKEGDNAPPPVSDQKAQAPETTLNQPITHSPSEPVSLPRTNHAVTNPSARDSTKGDNTGPRPPDIHNQHRKQDQGSPSPPDLTLVEPASHASANSMPQELEGAARPTAGAEVAQRLRELNQQLSKVRVEADLVRQLIRLEAEERRLFREIVRLEDLDSDVNGMSRIE